MSVLAFQHSSVQRMERTKRDTKEWIKAVADYLKLSPSRLALNSGSAASTVTRYLNDTTGTVGITETTLQKIARYSGVPLYRTPGEGAGSADTDAVPVSEFADPIPEWVQAAIAKLKEGNNSRDAWIMQGWPLDLKGILPGDIILVDMSQRPKSGDVVLAKIVDFNTGEAEHVVRLYDAPYILTHSAKLGAQKPMVVDEDRVSIRGVSIGTIRVRQ
ncbi:hypothetical protein M1D80_11925 [Phyllobacteriaceae bacterium JZ32]